MDRKAFFEQVGGSLFNGGISPGQRNGMAVKLDAFEEQGIADDRWWAYMLATSYHETGGAMLPVEEVGKGRGKPYGQKRQIAFLRTDLQRTREENTRFKGETRSREIRYDTSAPVDSTTGKPPVWSETVTCTRGRYERVVEDDEARQTEWGGTREAVAREHGTRSLAVDHHSTLDAAYEEQPRAPVSPLNRLNARLHRWLFLAGVIVGIAATVLVNTFLRK